MNLTEAEKIFKKYHGQEFHMAREDESLYHEYKSLSIPDELKNKWINDIKFIDKINELKKEIKHLYVHVPFCNSICFYCDFCHRVYSEELADRWLEHLEEEINKNCFNSYKTIYIGGGTPSCLNKGQLKRLLVLLNRFRDNVEEYTIEVNPESLNQEKIELFKAYGINRISMGVQSSDDELLSKLNRKHTFTDVINSVRILKDNGFNNISVDLMYSLPDQTIEMLNKTIDDILALDVPHISLYSLTIEENTVFGRKGYKALDEDTEADMYELIEKRLKENNYNHYEISNFAKEGYESKHNLGYWNYDDFMGVSLGASGKIGNYRYTNTRSFEKYFENIDSKDEELILDDRDMMFENIMMSLRTIYGLNINEFNKRYNCNILEVYPQIKENKYLSIIDDRLVCTNLEILNTVLMDFID